MSSTRSKKFNWLRLLHAANPQTEILDFWVTNLPPESPYSRTVLGSQETVERLSVEDCRQFHRRFFVPNNMVLAIFGDIDPDQIIEKLEASFGQVPSAKDFVFPKYPHEHPPFDGNLIHLTTRKDNTAMTVVGFPTVRAQDVETRSKLDVFTALMTGGGGSGGRLFQELRGERLVYYVFGMEITGSAPGYFLFMAQTRPDTVQEVIRRIQNNVSRVAKEGIPQAEFQLAKQKMIAAHSMQNVTPQAQAFEAAVDELLGFGYDHHRSYEDRINKVSMEDVRGVVRQYFQRAMIATSSPASTEESKIGERAARKK